MTESPVGKFCTNSEAPSVQINNNSFCDIRIFAKPLNVNAANIPILRDYVFSS